MFEKERKDTTMATKEFLQERISKAQEQISKKQNLITKMKDRIAKNRIKLQKLGFTDEQIEVGIDNPWNIPDDHPNCEKGYNLCNSIGTAMESITNAKKALPELQEKLQKYESEAKSKKLNIWSDYKQDYSQYLFIGIIGVIVLIVCIFDKSYRKKTVRKIKRKARKSLDKEVDKLLK
jgi:hypothetical protein